MNNKLLNKLNVNQLLIFVVILTIYFYLIFSNLIHYLVWTKIVDGEYFLFYDWQTIVYFNQCQSNNIDVYALRICDKAVFPYPMIYGYGPSFLWLPFPFFENLNFLYLKLIPLALIFIFVYFVIRIINPKSKISYILTFLILLNPSTIQLIEKFNFDLIVFLTTVLVIFINKKILNSILILIVASVKFYPIVLIYKFFFLKDNLSKVFLNIFITSIFFLIYFFFNIEDIKKIFESDMLRNITVGAKNFYIFSLNDYLLDRKEQILNLFGSVYLINTFKLIEIKLINIVLFAILVIFFTFLSSKKKLLDINIFEINSQLFLIGSTILISTYILHPNVFYREIFTILLIPLLIKLGKEYRGIFVYFSYFLIIKYFLDYSIILSDNNIFNSVKVTGFINTFLPLLDFIFMSFIFSLYLIFNRILFKSYYFSYKNYNK